MDENIKWRFGIVGNIIPQHVDDEGIIRYGTKAFTGGTKVYIDGKCWPIGFDEVDVIGRNRFHRYAIQSVSIKLIQNIRCQRIYKPKVIEIMERCEENEGWHWWGQSPDDRKESVRVARLMSEQYNHKENNAY